jgi:hypothetical protein
VWIGIDSLKRKSKKFAGALTRTHLVAMLEVAMNEDEYYCTCSVPNNCDVT